MNVTEALIEALKEAVSNWSSDFDIDVEESDADEDASYFNVVITYSFGGKSEAVHEFTAKVEIDHTHRWQIMMDYAEDSWESIDQENLFVWMWFDLVKQIQNGEVKR